MTGRPGTTQRRSGDASQHSSTLRSDTEETSPSPVSMIWDVQRAPELQRCIEDWYLTEFRWCNMGVMHPETGQGFGSTTKVLSSVQLWSGIGRPGKCSCLEGPGHVEHPLNVLRAWQRLRVEAWEKIHHYIFALCLSCKPLPSQI